MATHIRARSRVTLHLDRRTAALLSVLVGSLETRSGVGERLAPIFDELERVGVYDDRYDDILFRVSENGRELCMYHAGARDLEKGAHGHET